MASSKRAALWATGREETVEVNQRALIDKVLARYSGEFSVFRELLQNADDAGARSVEIRFETEGYLSRKKGDDPQSDVPKQETFPNLKTTMVHQWTFKNNGALFNNEDWNRLKKIAEGNPDEEKIGAFGVGFYSLFSVTEEPWVFSEGQWMNLYWKDKKDQLFARRGNVPASIDGVVDPWTTFQMMLREPGPIPPAFDFTRFLVSSIAFMRHLTQVSVYFDDKRLVKLSKNGSVPKEVPLLSGLKGTSPEGMMNVKSIQTMRLYIEAEVVRWVYTVGPERPSAIPGINIRKTATDQAYDFFSSLFAGFGGASTPRRTPTRPVLPKKESIDLMEVHSSNLVLTIFAANVDVQLDEKMVAELRRSTKKNPPGRLRYELIYTGKHEYDASFNTEEKVAYATESVFQGLRADVEGTGSARLFIGHSTGQTTGIGGHMAARFIPTVERESIDLVDRNVAVWNKELLYVGGFLARSGYEFELDSIKNVWDRDAATNGPGELPDEEVQTWLRGRALHALKFFTFYPSTPSSVVSNSMETAFFACATTHPFSVISSQGVRNVSQVHIPSPEFSGFLRRLPVISDDIINGAKTMIAALHARRMIKDVTFVDVFNELRLRPLAETEAVACLEWWIGVTKQGNNPDILQERSQLLTALVISLTGPPEKFMKLSDARAFLIPRAGGTIIPTDGPLPSTLLPTTITKSFDPDVLASVFPWKPLTIIDWLGHVIDPHVAAANAEFDITHSVSWAERVLSVLARAWPSLTKTTQDDVVEMLSPKACIPTSLGLKEPSQVYFPSVNLFRDLPIVTMPSGAVVKGPLEKVLKSLGVRNHIKLQIVFDRMIKTGDWTTFDYVKYLASIQAAWTPQELEHLRHTSAFPAEGSNKGHSATTPVREVQRHKVMDLYEPTGLFRGLGLPIIDWGVDNQWRSTSNEAKFLFSLGLRRFPPLSDVLHIAASDNLTVRTRALSFFLENVSVKYPNYHPFKFRDLAFIPAVLGSEPVLAKPFELYTGIEWAALGFAVVDPSLPDGAAHKLKLQPHPATSDLVSLFERRPPGDEVTARKWFEILSGRVSDFSSAELQTLSKTPFVPVVSRGDNGIIQRLPPTQCYISGTRVSDLHSKIFTFVDFGPLANTFLRVCGTKQEPSVDELAQNLLAEPRRIYELANGHQNYLCELRNIAMNRRLLTSGTIRDIQRSNMLLGFRRSKKTGDQPSGEGDEDDWDFQEDLLSPKKVAVVDGIGTYELFGDHIFCAPQEAILEELYVFLGSPRLSSLVREEYKMTDEVTYSKVGTETKHLILERLPLFLHEQLKTRTKISFDWLKEDKNFIVRVTRKLSVTKSLHHGDYHYCSGSMKASAVAKRKGEGPIELWLAGDRKVEMYEVSTSLCQFFFWSPKAHDVLTFMTILSTNLKVLERRGYNVERILRQQKAERRASEKASRAGTRVALISNSPEMTVQDRQGTLQRIEGGGLGYILRRSRSMSVINELGRLPRPDCTDATLSRPTSARSRSLPPNSGRSRREVSPPLRPSNPGGASTSLSANPSPSRPFVRSPQPGPYITSLSQIAKNVDIAMRGCKPDGNNLLRNRNAMRMVRESLDKECCDISGREWVLELVGIMDGMKVFATQDLPERESLIQRKRDVLARFIHILLLLVSVYGIQQTSLHVFSDKESKAETIALNKGGSLFVNLRYYEAWHDLDVQRGDFSKALTSWYFTLAHEIAHNLVGPHDSNHEFYFSEICQAYLVPLSKLLPPS